MLMLAHEMIRFRGELRFQPLSAIDSDELAELRLATPQKLRLLQKHLYRMGKGGKPVIRVKAPIIKAQDRKRLAGELEGAEKLGKTADQKTLLLCDLDADSSVLQELGRLREIAFRAVGEGTGQSKDTDDFDLHYRHIIVWDEASQEIAGAYRFAEVWKWPEQAEKQLYSSGLFEFSQAGRQIFGSGLELGRSFVQPQFWGQRSLDYLWQGIGGYLASHPHIRYLFGPVSLSARLPVRARDMLVWHYGEHYRHPDCLAEPKHPFYLRQAEKEEMRHLFSCHDIEDDFVILREQLRHLNVKVPTLYRQYSEICHPGGVSFSAFNVDAKFSLCLDSLVCVDLNQLKPQKYDRYIRPFLTKEESA